MKRDFSEALAQGKFELRLLVSSKAAGAVIGKGGDNIKRIRSELNLYNLIYIMFISNLKLNFQCDLS
uniref:KH_dom_type_1 domain-containing protein n=1 Tax=Heterorhabditis bacteriophora TaxID=37862 RepID=A0A1I7X1A1_HETBA